MQHVTGSYMGLYLHSPQTGNTYQGPNLSYVYYRLSLKQNILMRARLVNFQVLITYTARFATTIFSATQRCNVGTML